MASSSLSMPSFDIPLGLKFIPTKVDLLGYYLRNKVLNEPFIYDPRVMIDLNLYDDEPSDIWNTFGRPRLRKGESLYVFTELKKKSGGKNGGSEVSHTTRRGAWKGDTSERKVYVSENNGITVLGSWRRFRYESNEASDNLGSWMMKEYKLDDSLIPEGFKGRDLVLCQIRRDRKGKKVKDDVKVGEQGSSRS